MPVEADITALLTALREGDRGALDRLFPLVYRELHDRAHRQLARHRPGDTLSTTALVHEAYLKLTDSAHQTYYDRVHFFTVASRAMRQILVDYARRAMAAKRSGGHPVSLDPDSIGDPGRAEELLAPTKLWPSSNGWTSASLESSSSVSSVACRWRRPRMPSGYRHGR